jgi:diguanylate cyclase (GGDEF)-like protein
MLPPVSVPLSADEQCTGHIAAELARLRAQVAWLEAQRAELWWAASHDELTGLANRRLFCTLAPPLLSSGRPAAVIVVDLNGFKPINDTLGHEIGDRVLQIIAQRMVSCAGHEVVARLGGDEFGCVLTCPRPVSRLPWWQPAASALAAAIAEPMALAGRRLRVTASIGIATARGDLSVPELLRRADVAMYHAKTSGAHYAAWDGQALAGPDPGQRVIETSLAMPACAAAAGPALPTCEPHQRDPAAVASAATYRPYDPIWVYRDSAWRPGVVERASSGAVLATYRHADGAGTVVDTMTAEYVVARDVPDPHLDRPTAPMVASGTIRAGA